MSRVMADPFARTPVTEATAADLPELAAIEAEVFGADAWSPAQLQPEVAGGRLLVTRSDDRCAGYVAVAVAGDVADLRRIAVGSSYRRRGVATGLLDAALAAAGDRGADRMLLEVSEANAGARAFYEHHGFVEIARRERYYRDGTAALVLERATGAAPVEPGRMDG